MTDLFSAVYLMEIIADFGMQLLRVVFLLLVLAIIRKMGIRLIRKLFLLKVGSKEKTRQKETIEKMVLNVFKYAINIIGMLMIISVFVPIGTLMTGVGTISVIFTFAFQSTLADIVRGFFIIFEESFLVGDLIEVAPHKGEVLEIGLRITKLKLENGDLVLIPNSNIGNVVKFNKKGKKSNEV